MKIFVYSMREYDEKAFFDKYCAQYGVEYAYTLQTPSIENVDMCNGYDVVDIITTIIDRPMLDRFKANGIKCISTRTIGYDHIDTEYAKELGIGVVNVTYSPASVADYTIMLMLMGCRRYKHIMERADIQDFTLKGKIATNETRTVREFAKLAFEAAGIEVEFEGEGVNEIAKDKATGKVVLKVNPQFFRPAEVELLIGNPAKAEKELGWVREISFQELVERMVKNDLELVKKEM